MSRLTRIASTAAIVIFALTFTTTLSWFSSTAFAQQAGPQSQAAPASADVKAVLSQYGSFVQHPKYGEVWVPTVTPQGWHPYPPCHWVNTRQYGWYFDDRTPWGQIVHHYGRWAHDQQMGWIWIPGAEFSPGWVVWRTSPQWIGWAPMLPDEDIKTVSVDEFDNGGYWIFVEVAKFTAGCTDTVVAALPQIPALLKQTEYVTEFELVGGVGVFVLPPYILGPLVNIDIVVAPWPAWFFAQVVLDWNWIWNNLVVINETVYVPCPPGDHGDHHPPGTAAAPPTAPIVTTPPPVTPPGPPAIVSRCPAGTVIGPQGCFIGDPCGTGLTRGTTGGCEPIHISVAPPPPPTGGPTQRCLGLSGAAFRQCLVDTRGAQPTPIVAAPTSVPPIGSGQGPSIGTIRHPSFGGQQNVGVPADRGPRFPHPGSGQGPVRLNPNTIVMTPGGGGHNVFQPGGRTSRQSPPKITHTLPPSAPHARNGGMVIVR